MSTLKQKLSKYTDTKQPDYTVQLKKIIFNDTTSKIPDDYFAIIGNTNNNKTLRFSAFYCLFTQYRRFEQRYQMYQLVDTYLSQFTEDAYEYLCEIIWSQYYKFKFLDTPNKSLYAQASFHGKKAIGGYGVNSENIGCFNNYAEIVLDGLEHKNIVPEEEVSDAIQYVERAIYIQEVERQRPPYSRYYCSKARLMLYLGNFDDARALIAQAISYERTDEKDSLIRIAHYHNVLLDIKTRESLKKVDENVAASQSRYENILEQLEHQQIKYIEILGFFASTIALITGSIGIVLNTSDFSAASGLILCLAGCLAISFCVLQTLFSSRASFKRVAFGILLSVLLLFAGYLIGNNLIKEFVFSLI